ncbi:HlyD family efflux transporter periplasmic adaptor subunit [Pseudomonas knackmussii]|uniref:HlyD family secretion protein n=1 Tax=Pseudomonas knackmussii TaxID=65741 RepID=UPI003F4A18C3
MLALGSTGTALKSRFLMWVSLWICRTSPALPPFSVPAARPSPSNPNWRSGQWIGSRESLGVLIDPSSWQVDAYVGPDEVPRLTEGSPVRFYPEGVPTAIPGHVRQIGTTRINQLEQPALASRHGGPLAVNPQGEHLVPTTPLFHILVQLDGPPPNLRETRGHLQIEGQRRSLLVEGGKHLAAVVMRESGF